MSGASGGDRDARVDEFDQIERLFRPLTDGAPEALGLLDDAAVLRPPHGQDLVVTKDALVEGVHFLPGTPFDLVARKLLRVNLSDMAAMAARPFGYLVAAAWPAGGGWAEREAFAAGLRQDQDAFGVVLLGGDTVSTAGPAVFSLTLLGWAPAGGAGLRSGARPGDLVLVSGTIGDGGLGLRAARGQLNDLPGADRAFLRSRYELPQPRLGLAEALRRRARACADVSDGLIADAGRIAIASGLSITLDLGRMPLSPASAGWLARQPDRAAALADLAAAGDDYEIVCASDPSEASALTAAAAAAGIPLRVVGEAAEGAGVAARVDGQPVPIARAGWRHG